MKTSVIFLLLTALAVIIQGSPLFVRREESTAIDARTEAPQTCGDVSDLTPLYSVYIAETTAHIYTIYDQNISAIIEDDDVPSTQFLGVTALVFSISQPSTLPFVCLRNSASSAHFCSTNQTALDAALATGSTSYMTAGYVYPEQICGSVPLYQLQFIATNSDYIYTTSATERDDAITTKGFTYEGIAGYVYDLLSCENST
ncbi:hypothetical protein MSAN_02021800 [Mycena sanguinolenta]|uniref:DUF5648 domain-containing protein n=1 Tax=Mycena sanguinolenta TaxID=230812 RepID=A0A8H6XJD6_9AGAR|nr:hypothetical protein MSAN_02021800 [Mycena sanguinolenta]